MEEKEERGLYAPKRVPIQICYETHRVGEVTSGYLVALCNDGTIFQLVPQYKDHEVQGTQFRTQEGPSWRKLPPIPQ